MNQTIVPHWLARRLFAAIVGAFFFGVVLAAPSALAKQLCFELYWNTTSDADVLGAQKDGPQKFANVNGRDIDFYGPNLEVKDKFGKTISSMSAGCMSSGDLRLGQNRFTFSFVLGDGGITLSRGWLSTKLYLYLPDRSNHLLVDAFYTPDPTRTLWKEPRTVNYELKQIDPQLAAKAESRAEDFRRQQGDLKEQSRDFEVARGQLDETLAEIDGKEFDALNEASFRVFRAAVERYLFYKKEVVERQEIVRQKREALRVTVARVRDEIEGTLTRNGYDFRNAEFAKIHSTFHSEPFPELEKHEEKLGDYSAYERWADSVLGGLRSLYESNQRLEFLEKVRVWNAETADLLQIVAKRGAVDRFEFQAFEGAVERVRKYVFGNPEAGQAGILTGTKDLWFTDNPIPREERIAIEELLTRSDDPRLQAMGRGLRVWRSNGGVLGENRRVVLAMAIIAARLASLRKDWDAEAGSQKLQLARGAGANGRSTKTRPGSSQTAALSTHSLQEMYDETMRNYDEAFREMRQAIDGAVSDLVSLSPADTMIGICEMLTVWRLCDQHRANQVATGERTRKLAVLLPFAVVLKGKVAGYFKFAKGADAPFDVAAAARRAGAKTKADVQAFADLYDALGKTGAASGKFSDIAEALYKGKWSAAFEAGLDPAMLLESKYLREKFMADKGIPLGWEFIESQRKEGIRFFKPDTKKSDEVRVMPANPNSPWANSQVPYMALKKNGIWRDKLGAELPDNKRAEAHISVDEFSFPF